MPNIVCTYNCNQNCSYCFAGKTGSDSYYTTEIIEKQFPFIETSGRNSVSLVGGEPTLNPAFISLVKWLSGKNLEINIFSNGIISQKVIKALKLIDSEKIRFFINRSEGYSRSEVFNFYRSLGHLVHLAVTVFRPGQKIDHIPDEIVKFGLLKEFRIGIALPVYNIGRNIFLKPQKYKVVAQELIVFFTECLKSGITPIFDCGFPYCFFDDKQKGFLAENNISFSSNCGIIPDIDANYHLFPCFPLSEFKIDFSDMDTLNAKEKELQTLLNAKRRNQLFEECKTCIEMKTANCTGGCLSMQLMQLAQ